MPKPEQLSAEVLLHELQVHQIELEMQNETLRQSQIALEASRDRYQTLYEFAPVSFITLAHTGQIAEINLTGAAMLGESRNKLLQQRFSRYVLTVDRLKWESFFVHALKRGEEQNSELLGQRKDGTHFNAYLDSRIIKDDNGVSMLFLTLTDITKQKKAEAARLQFEMRLRRLSRREREVFALALTGISSKDISTHLKISQRTVDCYRSQILRKTGVVSMNELMHQAAFAGITFAEIVTLPACSE